MSLSQSDYATRFIRLCGANPDLHDAGPPLWDGVTPTVSELVTTPADGSADFLFVSVVETDQRLASRDRVHVAPSER
jgi:hypothetical protein